MIRIVLHSFRSSSNETETRVITALHSEFAAKRVSLPTTLTTRGATPREKKKERGIPEEKRPRK